MKRVGEMMDEACYPKLTILMMAGALVSSWGYCQEVPSMLGEFGKVYVGSDAAGNQTLAGFSIWGMVGGLVFGSIGLIAFLYGRKVSSSKPMVLGVALMVYPYLLHGTIAIYCVGIVLTASLYFFRE
ncbi:MAG: hypothetical protein ACI9CF_000895 [Candidatus Omnitrophota bacterium]|jgi:hypothetical protein